MGCELIKAGQTDHGIDDMKIDAILNRINPSEVRLPVLLDDKLQVLAEKGRLLICARDGELPKLLEQYVLISIHHPLLTENPNTQTLVIRIGESNPLLLSPLYYPRISLEPLFKSGDNNATVRVLALGVRGHAIIIDQGEVDDPTLIGVHRSQDNTALSASSLSRGKSDVAKLLPTARFIALDVDDDRIEEVDT